MIKITILLLLLALPSWAGDGLYKASVATYVASSVADVVSSYGSLEANPRMASANGRLGTRGVVMKAVTTTGVFVSQYVARKIATDKKRAKKVCTIMNFALAGVGGVVTVRNVRLGK